MIESLIFSIHFHLGVDYWSDLIIILLFDPSFIIFFPLFSPLSFLYKCVNLFGCSWILRFISLFVWGFVFCAVWPVKSWCYNKGVGPELPRWETQVYDFGPPENSQLHGALTGQEPSQRPPYQHWHQALPKGHQTPVAGASYQTFSKIVTQPCPERLKVCPKP